PILPSWAGFLLDLLSCPTRRSSDLGRIQSGQSRADVSHALRGAIVGTHPLITGIVGCIGLHATCRRDGSGGEKGIDVDAVADRQVAVKPGQARRHGLPGDGPAILRATVGKTGVVVAVPLTDGSRFSRQSRFRAAPSVARGDHLGTQIVSIAARVVVAEVILAIVD